MNVPEFKITAVGVVTNPADPDTEPDDDEDTEPDDDEEEIAQWLSH